MKSKVLLCLLLLTGLLARSLATSDPDQKLKQRRKGTHCNAYYQVSQHKSQLELEGPSIKVKFGNEMQLVKPSEETLRLGMAMKARCEAYLSDPDMSTDKYLSEIHQLEDKQRQIEKAFLVSLPETLKTSDKAEADKNKKKK